MQTNSWFNEHQNSFLIRTGKPSGNCDFARCTKYKETRKSSNRRDNFNAWSISFLLFYPHEFLTYNSSLFRLPVTSRCCILGHLDTRSEMDESLSVGQFCSCTWVNSGHLLAIADNPVSVILAPS